MILKNITLKNNFNLIQIKLSKYESLNPKLYILILRHLKMDSLTHFISSNPLVFISYIAPGWTIVYNKVPCIINSSINIQKEELGY